MPEPCTFTIIGPVNIFKCNRDETDILNAIRRHGPISETQLWTVLREDDHNRISWEALHNALYDLMIKGFVRIEGAS